MLDVNKKVKELPTTKSKLKQFNDKKNFFFAYQLVLQFYKKCRIKLLMTAFQYTGLDIICFRIMYVGLKQPNFFKQRYEVYKFGCLTLDTLSMHEKQNVDKT